jgi:hypothetical protein
MYCLLIDWEGGGAWGARPGSVALKSKKARREFSGRQMHLSTQESLAQLEKMSRPFSDFFAAPLQKNKITAGKFKKTALEWAHNS